ncbi:MAG: GNAT family N-acetyltransferase [Chloroflexota bacterium]
MRVLLRYAFQELPLNRVTLNVFEYNPRAVRSYEKAGFRVEGRVRGGLNRDGKRYDMIYMGILRAEWEALQGLPAAGDQRRLPHGFTDRPAAIEDIDAIVQAINAWSRELTGGSDLKPEDLRQQFEIPVFHLERDTRVVVDPAGEIAGYWELWDTSDPHVVMNAWGIVQPRCSGLGIGAYLIDWAEQRARSAIHLAPPDAQVSLHAYLRSNDVRSRRRYRDAGYEHIRNSLRMLIDLNEAPPEPVMPDGIQIRAMRPGVDDEAMTHAVRESFRDHWGFVERPFQDDLDRYRWEMAHDPHFKPELYLLAWDGDQIAGISLCSDYFDEDEAMGWVSTLGVCREWRKRGLGLALLQQSFVELYRHGKARIGLGVDAESLTGATRLYLKAGMRPDPLHEFHLYHKTLRPGKDLSTQSV